MDSCRAPETKLCKGCGQFLDVECFGIKYPERGVRQHNCRACSREASRMYYQRDPASYKARAAANNVRFRARNRQKIREYLAASACADCGISDFAVLEFDHRDPKQKRDDVGNLARQAGSWAGMSKEIAKCDVVCANCHRKRTARQFGWRRLLGLEPLVLPALPRRGTPDYERIKSTVTPAQRLFVPKAELLALTAHGPRIDAAAFRRDLDSLLDQGLVDDNDWAR